MKNFKFVCPDPNFTNKYFIKFVLRNLGLLGKCYPGTAVPYKYNHRILSNVTKTNILI